MKIRSLPTRSAFYGVLCGLSLSQAASASEWSVEPSISLWEQYDSNIHITTQPHSSVWMTRLSPKVKLSGKSEVAEVSGIAQLNLNRFHGESGLDSNDRYLSLLANRLSERNTWGLNVWHNKDSTTEGELLATGVVQARTGRSVVGLNPSWTRLLTERTSLKLDYVHQEVKYDTHINLNDFTYQQAGATLQYALTERDRLSVSANYSVVDYNAIPVNYLFVTDSVVNEIENRSLQVGASREFSETLRGAVSLGRRSTDSSATHTCPGSTAFIFPDTGTHCTGLFAVPTITFSEETESSGTFFNASAEKRFDTGKLSVIASRDVAPSGNGVVETNRIAATLNKSLTQKMTFVLDAAAYKTSYLSVAGRDSRFAVFEPKLNWRLTEKWSLDAGYRHARFSAAGSEPSNQTVFVSLAYNWSKIAFSR